MGVVALSSEASQVGLGADQIRSDGLPYFFVRDFINAIDLT